MPKKSKEELTLEEKKQRLHALMNEKNREYKDTVLKFAKDEETKERFPFGNKQIDEFTGNGGVGGNFIIIWGGEGVGKSTLALNQVATAQKKNKICAYVDIEHSFDKQRAELFGVNLNDLVLIENANCAEEAMDIILSLAKEKVVDLIILDSIQAMTPKAESEGKSGKERSMEEDEIALLAKKMGKFLRRCSTPIYKAKIAVTMIGQSRTGGIGSFATHEELTGGRASKHYSLLTLFMQKGPGAESPTEKVTLEEKDENGKPIKVTKKIGFQGIIKIQKTKVNSKPELSDLRIPFYFDRGFYNE